MVVRNVRDNEGRVLLEMLDHLRTGAQSCAAITVHVLVATDHDGVCSAKIFDILLQRNGVKSTWIPVTGNTEIVEHIRQFEAETEVRSLVLLNCGASLDLQRHLEESQAPADLNCFVIDAHRPFLLNNLSERSARVFVLDDDPIIGEGLRPPVDDDSEEETGEFSEEEKENEWDPNALGAAPRAPVDNGPERKRRRLLEREERHERRRHRINEYYLNSYFAMPAAMSLFKMARQAGKPTPDLLWLASVCLSGYHDLGLLGEVHYSRLASEELNDVLEQTDDLVGAMPTPSQGRDDSGAAASQDDRSTQATPGNRQKPQKPSLRFDKDLRLTLYKHWNLEECIMHSSYFYGALELHKDKGLRAKKEFFAAMGIAPNHYKQQYGGMPLTIKKALHSKFSQYGESKGLTDKMFLQQFIRNLGPRDGFQALGLNEISASDAANFTTALLSVVPPALGNALAEQLPTTSDGRRDAERVHEMERQALVDNFWKASEAVLCKDPNLVRDGILEAVNVAKAVQTMARYLIDTKGMRLSSSNQFRWCKIEQAPNYFRHHMTIRRLAVWLLSVMFAYRPKKDGGPEKPLLLIVRDHIRDTYVLVGASPARTCEQNEFGERFRAVLRTDRTLKYRYDLFDKSCIEIAADDFDRFWDAMVESIA